MTTDERLDKLEIHLLNQDARLTGLETEVGSMHGGVKFLGWAIPVCVYVPGGFLALLQLWTIFHQGGFGG